MFMSKSGSPTTIPDEVIRSTDEEKKRQINNVSSFKKRNQAQSAEKLLYLKDVANNNGNIFAALMEAVKYCSLGEITQTLYEVGGQYRRNM